jgi:hypothetical protein
MTYLRINRRFPSTKPTHSTFKIKFCNGVHQLINKQTDEPVFADALLQHVREYATKNNYIVVPT